MIADRFTMPEDVDWFDQALAKLVEEELGEEHKNMVDYGQDRYFVDFLRDAPEATGTVKSKRQSTGTFQHCCCIILIKKYRNLLLYCDPFNVKYFFHTGEEPEDSDFDLPKVYEPTESFESLKDRLNMFLSHYNESIRGTGMDMVFFQDAMIHLVKVH